MNDKIRVMVIDDSALMRNIISKILNSNDSIDVVGTAINGDFGLKKLNMLKPDVIVLDLEMPVMNGVEFLKERSRNGIKIPVIILSAHAKKGAKITLEALSLGASDFILKPSGGVVDIEKTKDSLIEMVLALAPKVPYSPVEIDREIKPANNIIQIIDRSESINANDYLVPVGTIPEIELLCIGISTGGPNALREILPQFKEDFPVPIVIVQHMPPGFTFEFANSLDRICPLDVKEASEGDLLTKGRIFIAPGDRHVRFERKKLATIIHLDDSENVNGHKPSASVLFASAAEVFGGKVLACIMTGMGRDGADNIGMVLANGGITLAQDQTSSVVFGMPRIAILNKHINFVFPLDKLADAIISIVKNKKLPVN